jgi:hypothetical protein
MEVIGSLFGKGVAGNFGKKRYRKHSQMEVQNSRKGGAKTLANGGAGSLLKLYRGTFKERISGNSRKRSAGNSHKRKCSLEK